MSLVIKNSKQPELDYDVVIITDSASSKIQILKPTSETYVFSAFIYYLRLSKIFFFQIENDTVGADEEVTATITFTNPLKIPLTNLILNLEGSGLSFPEATFSIA